jgi:ATP-dependent helicase HrpA
VKFMTDGILLAEIQGDPLLRAYDTILLDEAHERSLNIDFLLGYLKRLLPKRPDLRLIVSSATIEHARFAAFFDGAPVIEVSGRTYPVEVFHRPLGEDGGDVDLAESVAEVIEEITAADPREDILVFLPGEREIRETERVLVGHGLPHTVVLPLYGRLAQADQARVFSTLAERRIVLATNVAETSLTIPGIVYVVDTGLARVNRHDPRTGVTKLHVEPVARASADQRKGRAGRTRAGVCFRLYAEDDYALRPAHTDPELLRVGLAGVILQMKALGLGPIEGFPFLDPPPKRAVDEGRRVLEELGAVDDDGELTDLGKKLARLPLDPRLGRMLLAGEEHGALAEVLVIAAALGVQDPRERPLAAKGRADEAHRAFRDEGSDFAGLLKLFRFYEDARARLTQSQLRKLCRDRFLDYQRLREWSDVHQQLSRLARELGHAPKGGPASAEAVHRAILPGLLSRVGMWSQEKRSYAGARQTRFALHPSSGLAKKPPAWVVAAELVETSQLFARTAAAIDPAWLEAAAGPLVRRSYADPHWEARPAEVMAREHVTLFGLPIVRDRKVRFGPIDPRASRRLFILHALVRGEYEPREEPAFLRHNRALFEEVRRLRDRARQSDMLADDDAVAVFFEARVPDHVHGGKTFEAWRREAEAEDPRVLFLSLADVLLDDARDLTPERFPDALTLAGATLPLAYRFEPGEDDDGATLTVPLALLPALEVGVLDWTLPGWQRDKLALLLHGLPKAHRKGLGSIPELAATLAELLPPFRGAMLPALCRAIEELTGARIPESAFDLVDLPPHLTLHVRVVDGGRVVGEGRELGALKERFGARAREAWSAARRPALERQGLTGWTFDALPAEVPMDVGGARVLAYPALVDRETSVALVAMDSRAAADEATRGGLRRLFLLGAGTSVARLERELPGALAALGSSPGARRALAERAVDEAFALDDPASYPRTRAAFQERLDAGRGRLAATAVELGRLALPVAAELDAARAALRALAGKPGAPRAALDDVRDQLACLAPEGFLGTTTRRRLAELPRYLKAIRVRLERLPNGPQKDLSKAEQVLPFWQAYKAGRAALLARGVPLEQLEAFRWLVEEQRVSVFAPELRAAVPVSAQRLAELWRALAG